MKIFGDKQYLYQWDVNQKVISNRLELGDEIHFVVPDSEEVLICPVYEQDEFIMADIPNILLQTAGLIKTYEVAYDENGNNLNTYRSAVRVVKRPKPSDYAYTETEVKNYRALERRIEVLESPSNPINPIEKTDLMTKPVGVDSEGLLWVAEPSDEELLAALIEADMLPAVTTNEKILIDASGKIILRY